MEMYIDPYTMLLELLCHLLTGTFISKGNNSDLCSKSIQPNADCFCNLHTVCVM